MSKLDLRGVSIDAQKVLDILTEGLTELGKSRNIDYSNGTYMSVSVENCDFIKGVGYPVFSVCHYGKQNGDLMRDPEMLFFRTHENRYIPYYFRNDYAGYEEWSIHFGQGLTPGKTSVSLNKHLQSDHAEFASVWMENIREQQNLMVLGATNG